ncbi:MAG TPA: immune inhibitor A domain-containing protein [Ornithinibacter sp.]|nr:immune inhibitor A domain-containing protein [Ornithinibacter sp.]
MNTRRARALMGLAAASLAVGTATSQAQAIPVQGETEPAYANRAHDLPNPLGDALREKQRQAIDAVITGDATVERNSKGERVIRLNGPKTATRGRHPTPDKYVAWPVTRKEKIFTVLTDFGDATDRRTGGDAGPAHNEIARPDRTWNGGATDDNSTYWVKDFTRSHYQKMMFGPGESFRDFFLKQSNGRFETSGDVSDWVTVRYNQARYGSNDIAESDGYWNYVKDTATAWYDAQKAAGRTDAQVATYLRQFDQVDRYDYDGDGVHTEPDGYIDHFQAIHAGEGEEAGGGAQGEDAIWSHRWYAFSDGAGRTGPAQNKLGGVPLGRSGIWIGDYTTEPENGGLGVFTHEFGHDLGLPDLYDTAGGDNGTGFWTLMSGGSWMNRGTDSIGTTPGYMGAWEKLQLGWLDFQQVEYGRDRNVRIGPADRDSATLPQALLVTLPDKTVTTDFTAPRSGAYEWWGGSANGLNSTLARPVDLTSAASASVSSWVWYDIEEGYDFLYGEVSTDGGSTWAGVGAPIDGTSNGQWVQKSWDLSAHAGQQVDFRFRYASDGGVHFDGPFLDDLVITVDGATVLTDDVEGGTNGWAASGFTRFGGSTTRQATHYYLAENRVYSGYDATLRTGPYNFGWAGSRPNWVERFPYQNGLLVWYVDNQYDDNNTSEHPGRGQVLPVDARPAPVRFPDGALLGNRRQPFDATFGKEQTDEVTFHSDGVPVTVRSQRAISTFFDLDRKRYWTADNPGASVQVAGTGTSITVSTTSNQAQDMLLKVRFAK